MAAAGHLEKLARDQILSRSQKMAGPRPRPDRVDDQASASTTSPFHHDVDLTRFADPVFIRVR